MPLLLQHRIQFARHAVQLLSKGREVKEMRPGPRANKRRIAFGKAWKRRNRSISETSYCHPAGANPARSKSSRQVSSESCHSPGDRGVRSVDNKVAGREDSTPKSCIVARPTWLR